MDNTSQTEVALCKCGCGNPAPLAKQSYWKTGAKRGEPQKFIRGHRSRGRVQSAEEKARRAASMRAAVADKVTRITCPHKERRHYGKGMCSSCWKADWFRNNPGKQIGSAVWAKRNPERMRELVRKRSLAQYGLTPDQYRLMWERQGGKCANPGCDYTAEAWDARRTQRKGLQVDHDHVTGSVRGLLCAGCNVALGHVDDNLDRLLGLIEYLKG
jgi:Recombination endonuclease VII